MSELKAKRNGKMLIALRAGKTIYQIAKQFGLSWTRAKRIIQEQEAREAKANE
jgi:hypothetical protein